MLLLTHLMQRMVAGKKGQVFSFAKSHLFVYTLEDNHRGLEYNFPFKMGDYM